MSICFCLNASLRLVHLPGAGGRHEIPNDPGAHCLVCHRSWGLVHILQERICHNSSQFIWATVKSRFGQSQSGGRLARVVLAIVSQPCAPWGACRYCNYTQAQGSPECSFEVSLWLTVCAELVVPASLLHSQQLALPSKQTRDEKDQKGLDKDANGPEIASMYCRKVKWGTLETDA